MLNEKQEIAMQDGSLDIWDKKYRLKSKDGKILDRDVEDTYKRVAKALAKVEKPAKRKQWEREFLRAMELGATPAGRIMSNAGAEAHKPATSTINCTVAATVPDSMEGILESVKQAGLTLKAGCGIGYEFSTLRPKSAYVRGAGAFTSGPLSFMDIYDKMCFTISSAGGRRGAQMGTFDISHPDVYDFIKAKREDGRLRQFNLSVLVTKDFMEAVKADGDWDLVFPALSGEDETNTKIVYKRVANAAAQGYEVNIDGLTPCKVYKTIKAKAMWGVVMRSTYENADPGFLLIDEANRMNNNWFCEDFRASNPCGEQFLPQDGACLLGSVNLTKFVRKAFTEKAYFDWSLLGEVVRIFTRMLDNVVEINGLPLAAQREEILRKRRHGMGFLGLGSVITMLGMQYGSKESVLFTRKVAKAMAVAGLEQGIALAKEKGCAPIFNETMVVDRALAVKAQENGIELQVDDVVGVKDLWYKGQYITRLFDHISDADLECGSVSDLQDAYFKYGCRFTHHSSIAPTGTIALSLANNASNGIEPSFAHHYSRNVIREDKQSKEKIDVYSYELLAYRALINPNAMPHTDDEANKLPDYFIDADKVTPKQHIDIQAAAQFYVDSAISKTCNVATDMPYEDFQNIYMYAYESGLKGCTTFRFNPEVHQGVLVRDSDLEATKYKFTLADGSTVELKGNEEIEYAGEMHTASNLYDALKEGWIKTDH